MIKYRESLIFLFSLFFTGLITSCVDDDLTVKVSEPESPETVLKGVPKEILDGYSISFNMSVASMDGGDINLTTRVTNQDLRTIEDFVDLEKLRILFFTCLDDSDYVDQFAEEWKDNESTGKKYQSGKHDVFLFEAKSRWVSILSTSEASDASYQVTTPVFTLGSEEDTENYDWDYIRKALIERPFKIAILVNRPEKVHYSDFDSKFSSEGSSVFNFPNKGPYWSKKESDEGKRLYELAEENGFKNIPDNKWNEILNSPLSDNANQPAATINDLHHCQWDPVYTNKNSIDGYRYYNYLLKNVEYDVVDYQNEQTWISKGQKNAMGAVSDWTEWLTEEEYLERGGTMKKGIDYNFDKKGDFIYSLADDKKTKMNFYKLPSQQQGIPMYGVQRFDALKNWKEGTPIHLSTNIAGDESEGSLKNITLLRSLARIELLIPKSLGTVTKASLRYSNVYGRCEPLDVATPTNEIWERTHTSSCEWNDIYKYGPIINGNIENKYTRYKERTAWFYGAWRSWWNFNNEQDLKTDATFDNAAISKNGGERMPYPHVFNPCIQRNGDAYLEFINTTDDFDTYYHYVVYTGERNINDPSKFENGSSTNQCLYPPKSEHTYFTFLINGKTYNLAINPYNSGAVVNKYLTTTSSNMNNYRDEMANGTSQNEWSWPIMRNHVYVFRVIKANNKTDTEGINVMVIEPENRTAPDIEYY